MLRLRIRGVMCIASRRIYKSEVVVFGASRDAPHRRLWNFTLGGEPVRVSSGFRYLGVELQQDVEVGIARPVAEARRTAVLARVASERMNLLRVTAASPLLTPLDSRQVYCGSVRGVIDYCSAISVLGDWAESEDVQPRRRDLCWGWRVC